MIEYTILKITRQMEAEGNIHSIYTQWLSGKESPCSSVQLYVIPWTVALQAPLTMGFIKQGY